MTKTPLELVVDPGPFRRPKRLGFGFAHHPAGAAPRAAGRLEGEDRRRQFADRDVLPLLNLEGCP